MIQLEIKLFVYTKLLDALFKGNKDKMQEQLSETLGTKELPGEFWGKWLKRYDTLLLSKELQVTLLREVGYSYQKIQDIVGVSPNSIHRILNQYTVDYKELNETYMLDDRLKRLESRLKKAGVKLW